MITGQHRLYSGHFLANLYYLWSFDVKGVQTRIVCPRRQGAQQSSQQRVRHEVDPEADRSCVFASTQKPPGEQKLASAPAKQLRVPATGWANVSARFTMVELWQFVIAAASGLVLAGASAADASLLTPKHEAGRCAIRDQCGSKGLFGDQLPCVDNGLAGQPDEKLREQLVGLCGEKWREGPVCCSSEQVMTLKRSLNKAKQMMASCPACKDNFYNMFCVFMCSPDQSVFVNVTKATQKNGRTLVTELDQLISASYGTGLYDSCKDVKFGPTNTRAMDLIGGGATNYSQMLSFLGRERLGGSPFQINFPAELRAPDMAPLPMSHRKCNDEDASYRCSCVDCAGVCSELPVVGADLACKVGSFHCASFAAILGYGLFVLSMAAFVGGRAAWRRHSRRRTERLRLLSDAAPSDDEDGGNLTQNAAMLDMPPRKHTINTWCATMFGRLGYLAARFPAMTILASLLLVTFLSAGWVRFDLEQNPARLWVGAVSAAAREKAFFDHHFGPFYRAEKIFLVNDTLASGPGPVLDEDTLKWWIKLEKEVSLLRGTKFGTTLHDICAKPTGSACIVQSVGAYFDNDPHMVGRDWQDRLRACADSPVECRPAYGQPLPPSMILGGYANRADVASATAMTVTWVVNNYAEGSSQLDYVKDWETALRDRLLAMQDEARHRRLRLSFSTEISLEQELNKSANTDANIVIISYVMMFLYASLALGFTTLSLGDVLRCPSLALVQSKFSLAVVGILIVLMSMVASIGVFSWVGLKATLIIVDVIPFIVLAVGVDNIFLIVHQFERVNIRHADEPVERRASRALGRMGPSILFSAMTETVSFALGAFVAMPAVRNFAVYAAGAVVINAVLQVTMFVSVLALNQMRVEDGRADCLPCVPVKVARTQLDSSIGHGSRGLGAPREGLLQSFLAHTYGPRLLDPKAKLVIVAAFVALAATGIALMPRIELGLDQRIAIPDDSYLLPYFDDLDRYMDAGPPVYFVTRRHNATQRKHQQELCSRYTTCQPASLANLLELERKRGAVSYIASPTASWIDDFFQWLNPENEACCVEAGRPCFSGRDPPWNITLAGMPEGAEFVHYLRKFLDAPTDEDCPLGGRASYGNAVVIDGASATLSATHFRTAHTPLRSQADYMAAYASARRIASEISHSTGVDVFPYSVFYIFFDQYVGLVRLSQMLFASAAALIFLLAWLFLGSVRTAAVVTATVAMTMVDILGAMSFMGVSLNAVSLVNLIICAGIAVEFCAHIARAFQFPARHVLEQTTSGFRDRDARAWAALANVGGSVLSGITMTKVLGVAVLAFTRSKILKVYYFRIWAALVISAALHALVFLPVALSVAGGHEAYVDLGSSEAGGLEEDRPSRPYRSILPERVRRNGTFAVDGPVGLDQDDEDSDDLLDSDDEEDARLLGASGRAATT